ncbi:DUF3987 domain-containing protein [Vibrio alginolyticus]
MINILKPFFTKESSLDPETFHPINPASDCLTNYKSGAEFDEPEVLVIPPKLRPEGLKGLIGHIANDLSDGTEASAEFIAAYLKVRLSSCIPRGFAEMPFGAFVTQPRINCLLALPTGEGKGLAEKQANAVINTAQKLLENTVSEHSDLPFYSRVHAGGLSTGEGIAFELRDDSVNKKGEIEHGVKDKRLCVVESEFANLLIKCNTRDSILSGTIRKLFDGDPIEPMTKTDRTSCNEPHAHIVGYIPPKELVVRMDSVSISNGFANRFPIYSGIQQLHQPIPKVIDRTVLESHAKELNKIITWCHQEKRTLTMSDCYKNLWIEKYSDLKQIGAKDSIEQSLMTRAPHYATMYAMLFAMFDMSTTVTSDHLKSSLAWIDYWHDSVRYIFNPEADAFKAEKNNLQALEVLNTIRTLITENGGQPITRTPLQQALGKNYTSKQVTDLLKLLQELPRSPIVVTKYQHNKQVISLT